MAKIAVGTITAGTGPGLERALATRHATGSPGQTDARVLAQGSGWTVDDVVCTAGPRDRPFVEQHSQVRIAIVAAGTFQYRASMSSMSGQADEPS